MANEKRNTNGIKRAAALGMSSALAFSLWGTALAAPPLKDVGASYAANEINTLVEKGIISGYEDGSFSPLGNLTRAELAKIITAATGLAEDSSASGKFQDVEPGSWYSGYVGALAKAGITDGTSETTFSPSANVTREQMTVFLLRAVNLEKNALNGEYASPFEDKSDISAWAAKQVGYAYQIGLYTGFTGKPLTSLEPRKAIKRQDAVKLAYEALKYAGKDKPGQPGQPGAVGSLELKSATAVIGGENYTAEHNGNGAFVISLPKGIDPEAKLTGFQLKASLTRPA
ncbi:S-layer homology domain-containing protein [Paenibacillus sp. CC-CFT747]|nr:S-layer homology domain-containing protein [Paenibacillus sp. CC-CFT747]